MFLIKSTQLMEWPGFGFTLRKGDNELLSRKAVPAVLWPKLDRFRKLGLLAFEGEAKAGEDKPLVLAELTERQLYAMPKDQLLELARANGITAGDDAKKKELLDQLVPKAKPAPKLEQDEGEGEGDEKTVELTEEALSKLNLEELRAAAEALKVDAAGLTKKQIVAKLVSAGTPPTPASASTNISG
jgi:hypothetical protein